MLWWIALTVLLLKRFNETTWTTNLLSLKMHLEQCPICLRNEPVNASTQLNNILFWNTIHTNMYFFVLWISHPLWHALISNTTWSIPIAHYCLHTYLVNYTMHGERSKSNYLTDKCKPMHWVQVMNTITSKVKCRWQMVDQMITDITPHHTTSYNSLGSGHTQTRILMICTGSILRNQMHSPAHLV